MFKFLLILLLILQCFTHADTDKNNLHNLFNYLKKPPKQINVAKAKLLIDKVIDPSIDIDYGLYLLDELESEIRQTYGNPTADNIRDYLFRPTAENNYHYQVYPPKTPQDRYKYPIESFSLYSVLDRRVGTCLPRAILLAEIFNRFGYWAYLSKAPFHMFVLVLKDIPKTPQEAEFLAIETGKVATVRSKADLYLDYNLTDNVAKKHHYLKPLNNKQACMVPLLYLTNHFIDKNDFKTAMYIADYVLKNDRTNTKAFASKQGIYTKWAIYESKQEFYDPSLIKFLTSKANKINQYRKVNGLVEPSINSIKERRKKINKIMGDYNEIINNLISTSN